MYTGDTAFGLASARFKVDDEDVGKPSEKGLSLKMDTSKNK